MGGYFQGAYAQPLQRQTILGSGVDPAGSSMDSGYAAPEQAPSLGQPTSSPSRFQSILGSLSQWNRPSQGTNPNQNRSIGGLFTL